MLGAVAGLAVDDGGLQGGELVALDADALVGEVEVVLGEKLAQKILGLAEGKTAFDIAPFPTRPFYRGNPWFVPLAMRWFRRQDRKLAKGA